MFPSTSIDPTRRCPPSTTSVEAVSSSRSAAARPAHVVYLLSASNWPSNTTSGRSVTPYRSATTRCTRSISLWTSRATAPGRVTMKFAWVSRNARPPADYPTLQPGPVDQGAGARQQVGRYAIGRRVGILEDAAGARQGERLRPLAEPKRVARHHAQTLRRGRRHRELGPGDQFTSSLHAAPVVAELHRVAGRPHDAGTGIGAVPGMSPMSVTRSPIG